MRVTKEKLTFNSKVFNEKKYQSDLVPPYCHGTTCCSLAFLSLKNYHSEQEIKEVVKEIKNDSLSRFHSPKERDFGERTLAVIVVSPQEQELENKLINCGFYLAADNLKRRNGYDQDSKLKLYLYSF